MASYIAKRCCLLYSRAGISTLSQRAKQRAFVKTDNNILQQSVISYGTRRIDTLQDTQVSVPIVSYSRSSGPGGQHVNKVSTKAEVRFHLHTADWIPEDVRQKIFEKNKNRINKAGELLVTSELSRSQQRNLSDCIQKISAIIAEASETPHEPTAEDIALRECRLEKRNRERLSQKKIHSATKKNRRVDFD
ncbi:uncharacterized protein V6R79_000203 [Siganus canaliculatus]